MQPLVSIIITTYGGGECLKRAITSVLDQTYENTEIIVVDDNNPDSVGRRNTVAVMHSFTDNPKVLYIQHDRNKNGAAARNTGIRAAKGKYISFLDDDDYYLEDRIRVSTEALEADEGIDGICVGVLCCVANEIVNVVSYEDGMELNWKHFFTNQNVIGSGSNIFVRANSVREIGGFDESFNRFQDVEFMIRFLLNDRIVCSRQIQVVKIANIERLQKYKIVLRSFGFFDEKFQELIAQLNPDELYAYKNDRYLYLYRLAIEGGNRDELLEAADRLSTIRELRKKEKVETKYASITSVYWRIKTEVKSIFQKHLSAIYRIKYTKKDEENRSKLEPSVLEEFDRKRKLYSD